MLLQRCLDVLSSKQLHLLRSLIVSGSQTTCWSSKYSVFPSPPKRPGTAYTFYVSQTFSSIKKENPSLSNPDLFLKLAEMWRQADKNTVERCNKLALDAKQKYDEEKKTYQASLTPEVMINMAKDKILTDKKAQRKQLKALGMPKKAPNAYILFASDFVKNNNENVTSVIKNSQKVASAWASLSSSEKSKWIEMAAAKEKEYKKKLGEWEADMSAKGHLEIIHTKAKSK